MEKALIITIPHSGEKIPPEGDWLKALPEPIQMCDVDRYVDRLYGPIIKELGIDCVMAEWHRYVADLNRLPEDVDADSVEGHANPPGTHTTGLHWVKTTRGDVLMPNPITAQAHDEIVEKFHRPFHVSVENLFAKKKSLGLEKVYHLDAHSMPSVGTSAHRDPGERRAEIVVSDSDGKSCEPEFRDLVVACYEEAGFQVVCNWPYKGGRVTQTYGHPSKGQHSIQVELNRDLYMDEETKKIKEPGFSETQVKIEKAVRRLYDQI
jgi:N-formylglutamate amidohydrolase